MIGLNATKYWVYTNESERDFLAKGYGDHFQKEDIWKLRFDL